MQTWLNFWTFLFWLSIIGFLINLENFLKLLLYSEMVWLTIYCYTVMLGTLNNDITVLGTSFYILAIAGLEFSIGMLLILLFKSFNKSISINNDKNKTIINNKKINLNKTYWNWKYKSNTKN